MMEPNIFTGFRKELTKLSEVDTKRGLQGAALGAVIGAVIGGVSPLILAKMIARNADLAALLGGMMGAGALGSAGFLLGKRNQTTEAPKYASVPAFAAKTGIRLSSAKTGLKTFLNPMGASLAAKVKGTGRKLIATPQVAT